MKVSPKPLLKRLARDLVALWRLLDMLVQESERHNGRAARRKARQKANDAPHSTIAPAAAKEAWPEEEWPDLEPEEWA